MPAGAGSGSGPSLMSTSASPAASPPRGRTARSSTERSAPTGTTWPPAQDGKSWTSARVGCRVVGPTSSASEVRVRVLMRKEWQRAAQIQPLARRTSRCRRTRIAAATRICTSRTGGRRITARGWPAARPFGRAAKLRPAKLVRASKSRYPGGSVFSIGASKNGRIRHAHRLRALLNRSCRWIGSSNRPTPASRPRMPFGILDRVFAVSHFARRDRDPDDQDATRERQRRPVERRCSDRPGRARKRIRRQCLRTDRAAQAAARSMSTAHCSARSSATRNSTRRSPTSSLRR